MTNEAVPDVPPVPDATVYLDAAGLKALADPLRLRLLLEMGTGPRTVKELAALLGVPATRLYYHVKILERNGFIAVARRRMVSGIEERSYQATATNWSVAPSITSALAETGALKAMFDAAGAELTVALSSDTTPIGETESAVPLLSFTQLSLTPKQIDQCRDYLASLMDLGAEQESDDAGEYRALFVMYRTGTPDAS